MCAIDVDSGAKVTCIIGDGIITDVAYAKRAYNSHVTIVVDGITAHNDYDTIITIQI